MRSEIEEGLEEYEVEREEQQERDYRARLQQMAILRDIAEVKVLMELEELEKQRVG